MSILTSASSSSDEAWMATDRYSAKLWGGLIAVVLSISWLIPNHYQPWLGFHSEAWIGVWGLLLSLWAILFLPKVKSWPLPIALCLALCAMPWLQLATGLLPHVSFAWISFVYLISLCMALLVGWHIQNHRPKLLLNILSGGIVLGSVISVGIQLVQWLQLYASNPGSWFSLLIHPIKDSARPMSNIAQPNLLATLLVTGMACLLWLHIQDLIKRRWLIMFLVILCFGLALTQSRVGMLELAVLSVLSLRFRRLWPDSLLAWLLPAMLVFRGLLFFILPIIADALDLGTSWRGVEQITANTDRLTIWRASLELIGMSPWVGQGWRSMLVPLMNIPVAGYLGQTHSILLDLLLWCGVPLGSLIILMVCLMFVGVYRRISKLEHLLVFMMVMALVPHALVELPHQSLPFLIIPGIAMGALLAMQNLQDDSKQQSLSDRLCNWPWRTVSLSWPMFVLIWLMAAVSAHFMIKDYFRAEAHMWQIRLEDNNGLPITEHEVPPMLALGHLQSMLELLPKKPSEKYSAQDLEWMERALDGEPTPTGHFVLMASMALAGHNDRARYLMWTLNKSIPESERRYFKPRWQQLQQQYPQLAQLKWPEKDQMLVKPQGGEKPFKAPKVP
jgi:O-antigen ligase